MIVVSSGQLGGTTGSKPVMISGAATRVKTVRAGLGQILTPPAGASAASTMMMSSEAGTQNMMIGGKPVTVLTSSAGGKMQLVSAAGQPVVMVAGNTNSAQSVTSRSDAPGTSDAALAQMAAEAGLLEGDADARGAGDPAEQQLDGGQPQIVHGMMLQQYPPAQPAPQANMSSCEHQVCMQRGGNQSHMSPQNHINSINSPGAVHMQGGGHQNHHQSQISAQELLDDFDLSQLDGCVDLDSMTDVAGVTTVCNRNIESNLYSFLRKIKPWLQRRKIKDMNVVINDKKIRKAKYSDQDLHIGMMILFQSVRCYNFLRQNKILALPSKETIRKKIRPLKFPPGKFEDFLSIFSEKLKMFNDDKAWDCSIMFDEMDLRSQVSYSSALNEIFLPFKKAQVNIFNTQGSYLN